MNRLKRLPFWLQAALILGGVYLLLSWRFFIIGSEGQRFLYGYSPQFLNGYLYFFDTSSFPHPWQPCHVNF